MGLAPSTHLPPPRCDPLQLLTGTARAAFTAAAADTVACFPLRPSRCCCVSCLQKINHFSGMLEICRKRAMARNLMKMARVFPQHYDFFPKTFILPSDREVRLRARVRAV